MLIDWFTVVAQALNFLILVWLLKRFLYRPILNAIDAREQRIAGKLEDADARMTEARMMRDSFQHKNEEFERQRAALMQQATEEARAERQRLLDEARSAADTLSARRHEALINDSRNLDQALGRRARQEVFSIARKALADLADANLEERMADTFMRRLREMDGQAKSALGAALRAATEPVLICSAFDLAPAQRSAIQDALNESFAAAPATPRHAGIPVRFETDPDLVCGIEITANGQKMAWSIADYLASLEISVSELIAENNDIPMSAALPAPEPRTP